MKSLQIVTFEAGEVEADRVLRRQRRRPGRRRRDRRRVRFGTLPVGVTEGAIPSTTVTLADADPAQIDFTVATSEVAEGGDTTFTFAFVQAVTFERDQTIDLNVGGSATAGDDFIFVDVAPGLLPETYAITFPAESSEVNATIMVVDDSEIEAVAETVTLSATLATTNQSLGAQTITFPASDVPDTPVVTIAAGNTVPEGAGRHLHALTH